MHVWHVATNICMDWIFLLLVAESTKSKTPLRQSSGTFSYMMKMLVLQHIWIIFHMLLVNIDKALEDDNKEMVTPCSKY